MRALALVRLWREVLSIKLKTSQLLSHSASNTLSGLSVTTLLHLAIVNNIQLPTAISAAAAWVVPNTCDRWSERPGARPREPCPSGRCRSCDAGCPLTWRPL